MGGDQRDQSPTTRRIVYILLATFISANLYFMWLSDIIQDISEGFSTCEKRVIVLFNGKNASELPFSSEEALSQWFNLPGDQPKYLGNLRQSESKGFVSILIPVTNMENKTEIWKMNSTLQSLTAHSWTKDQLEMSIILVIYTTIGKKDTQSSRKTIKSLIEENIYFINLGFLAIVQIPVLPDAHKAVSNRTNDTEVLNFDNRAVFQSHSHSLFSLLERSNMYVTFLCPGFVSETRILPVMHQHLTGVSKSNYGPYKIPVGDRWMILDFAREDPLCPLVGRFLRVGHLKNIYAYMELFPAVQTLSDAMHIYLSIKSQFTVYLIDPVLFRNSNPTTVP